MEITLFAITAGSLIVALVMGIAAWRLSREERARAGARVAALAAAASGDANDPVLEPTREPAPVRATTVFPSERIVVTPPRTADFALKSPVRAADLALNTEPVRTVDIDPEPPVGSTFLSTAESPDASSGRQRALVFAAAALLVVLAGGAYVALSNSDGTTGHTAAAAAAPASTAAPLELISLRQERRGAKLTLSGLVRNPTGGVAIQDLAAVVFLFDAQGGFISSARTGVDFRRLGPGDESPFVISADAPGNVARYRVSFRTDAGIVSHVDRRNEQPIAAAAVDRD